MTCLPTWPLKVYKCLQVKKEEKFRITKLILSFLLNPKPTPSNKKKKEGSAEQMTQRALAKKKKKKN